LPLLQSDFELTWKNIKNTDFVGYSRGYHKKRCAVGTTNGAGPHNVQIFVLTPDEVVLHALPGFWHPEDLARELRLAQSLFKLWKSKSYTVAQKRRMFRRIQLNAVRTHPVETFARSAWQGFDVRTERVRDQRESRDTFFAETAPAVPRNLQRLLRECTTLPVQPGQKIIKPINLIVHERMANRPFVRFADFDTKRFVDYGKMHYDLNDRRDGNRGKKFAGQQRLMRKRAIEKKKARRVASRS
jgi:hypothetical protein